MDSPPQNSLNLTPWKPHRTATIWISTLIVIVWCLWYLVGFFAHCFPGFGVHNLKFPATQYWPDGHQVFPSFSFVGQSFTIFTIVSAITLLTLQLFAITLRSRPIGLTVGLAFTLFGLPMLCLRVLFEVVPFGKIDPAHDLVWDTLFSLGKFGSWTIAGLCMILWASRSTRDRPTKHIGRDTSQSPL